MTECPHPKCLALLSFKKWCERVMVDIWNALMRIVRRSRFCLWAGLPILVLSLTGTCAKVNLADEVPAPILWQRADGTDVAYYVAGDEFLTAGLELLDNYWNDVRDRAPALLRGHVDTYLPRELQDLDYEPAQALMAEFADQVFAARDPESGLVPYSYDAPIFGNPERSAEATLTSDGKQPVGFIAKAVEFCRWFPENQSLRDRCAALAQSTIDHFDVPTEAQQPTGVWGWVDVSSDRAPRSSLTLTHDYGDVALGMAQLSQLTNDPYYAQWANDKVRFVWQHPMSTERPLLHEQFVLTQALDRPDEPSSDTDTLYFVRRLFELYRITGNADYRDWAMAVTDLWFDRAWNPQWGHFVRKLNPDGTPAVDTLYGDGKYNTLYILVHAFEVTGDKRYLERLELAWQTLMRMGQHGLAPDTVVQGAWDSNAGLDAQQTFFLDILVEAYKASGDRAWLEAAEALGRVILQQGTAVMRLESGQAGHAFLKLALARHPIRRVALTLEPATPLRVDRNGQTLLEATPPTSEVVVYLPEGDYTVVTP